MHSYKDTQTRNHRFIKELKLKPTKAELILKQWFFNNKIKAIFQKGFLKPFHRIVDFYIPNGGLILEIDGKYHKNDILKKDYIKDLQWKNKRKMKTIRIKNEDVYNGKYKEILNFLVKN